MRVLTRVRKQPCARQCAAISWGAIGRVHGGRYTRMRGEDSFFRGLPNERGLIKMARAYIKAPLGQVPWKLIGCFSRAKSGAHHKAERCSCFQCQAAWQSHMACRKPPQPNITAADATKVYLLPCCLPNNLTAFFLHHFYRAKSLWSLALAKRETWL
jgi:hypothetical protein